MGKPITTTSGGICFAFPNVCMTTFPVVGPVPIPYPSVGQLSDANPVADTVLAGGNPVVTKASEISTTSGDEAADANNGGKVEFASYSTSVKAGGNEVVRLLDQTLQNNSNATGTVLGGFATVLVGD